VQAVVVEPGDVLDDGQLELRARTLGAVGDQLGLEGVDEALGHRVVVGVADGPNIERVHIALNGRRHIGIDQLTSLIAGTGHQVSVSGERLLNRGVSHELLNRLGVDSSVNQQRGKGMSALVKGHGSKRLPKLSLFACVGLFPRTLSAVADGLGVIGGPDWPAGPGCYRR
jgi:hypothetical protein